MYIPNFSGSDCHGTPYLYSLSSYCKRGNFAYNDCDLHYPESSYYQEYYILDEFFCNALIPLERCLSTFTDIERKKHKNYGKKDTTSGFPNAEYITSMLDECTRISELRRISGNDSLKRWSGLEESRKSTLEHSLGINPDLIQKLKQYSFKNKGNWLEIGKDFTIYGNSGEITGKRYFPLLVRKKDKTFLADFEGVLYFANRDLVSRENKRSLFRNVPSKEIRAILIEVSNKDLEFEETLGRLDFVDKTLKKILEVSFKEHYSQKIDQSLISEIDSAVELIREYTGPIAQMIKKAFSKGVKSY